MLKRHPLTLLAAAAAMPLVFSSGLAAQTIEPYTRLPPLLDVRAQRLMKAQKDRAEYLSRSPWVAPSLSSDRRATALLAEMTVTEKMRLLYSKFAALPDPTTRDRYFVVSAGYVQGIKRLGVPPLIETDGELGVTNAGMVSNAREATALPSMLATAATWQPQLAREGGALIAQEARHFGFNALLAGNAGLVREPRAGRTFETPGEDPLLAGSIAGAKIAGIQSRHVLATAKHFVINAQETGRQMLSANIEPAALAESDLLAFEYALEQGRPGAVMCGYNRVNQVYACENPALLTHTLKERWQYPGFVLSDWGAVHSAAPSANAGLDQQSAAEDFDGVAYFQAPLEIAVAKGEVSPARIDDMLLRILRSYFAVGLMDDPVQAWGGEPVDLEAHGRKAREIAENAMVLLRNQDNLLPLDPHSEQRIAVIGAHADRGVLAGGGSSTVYPVGGDAVPEDAAPPGVHSQRLYPPSAPVAAIKRLAPQAQVRYADGKDIGQAAALAGHSDLAMVFVGQWMAETFDLPSLSLGREQNDLIKAVAEANPRTLVIIESGGPVTMPWQDRVKGILAAWYPGQRGGEAIANLLFGVVNPAGRLPLTFPMSEHQLPRPAIPGWRIGNSAHFDVDYDVEGADVGYRWFAWKERVPRYPFGFGLSYTRFQQGDLRLERRGQGLRASFSVRNIGRRAGRAVPQLYVWAPDGSPLRLAGWQSLWLEPKQQRRLNIDIDPRQLARFDTEKNRWRIAPGKYRLALATSSRDFDEHSSIELPAGEFVPIGNPGPPTVPLNRANPANGD